MGAKCGMMVESYERENMTEIKQVSTRIPLDLYRKVKIKAARTGKTMTEIIRKRLEEWVELENEHINEVQRS